MDLGAKTAFKKGRRTDLPRDFVFDYKDVDRLKRYITERGKIFPRRMTGLSRFQQKQLENAIKRARKIGLISYTIHAFKVDFSKYHASPLTRLAGRHPHYSRGGAPTHRSSEVVTPPATAPAVAPADDNASKDSGKNTGEEGSSNNSPVS